MTEWNAAGYAGISALQQAMAEAALAHVDLAGATRIVDVGCGDGRITAEIARRAPAATVLGIDPSAAMIDYAREHHGPAAVPNLRFEVGDARTLGHPAAFDFAVSFNALHWIRDQDRALAALHAALVPGARALLRLVPRGARKSLEDVLDETRQAPRWAAHFGGYVDPYLHWTPDEYRAACVRAGFVVRDVAVEDRAWDFGAPAGFAAFGNVTMVEWTKRLPEAERPAFVADVLARYAPIAGDAQTFRFYQMNVALARP